MTYMNDGTSLRNVRQVRRTEYPECYWDLGLTLCYQIKGGLLKCMAINLIPNTIKSIKVIAFLFMLW